MSKTESEWLGGAQTASYLGVTAMTIWRWQRDPKLAFPASTVIRGRKYWSRDDIDAWMRRMATGKADPAEKVAELDAGTCKPHNAHRPAADGDDAR